MSGRGDVKMYDVFMATDGQSLSSRVTSVFLVSDRIAWVEKDKASIADSRKHFFRLCCRGVQCQLFSGVPLVDNEGTNAPKLCVFSQKD